MNRIRTSASAFENGRTIVGRLLPGTDLIRGVEQICREHDLSRGSVVAGIGSLERAQFTYAIPDEASRIGIAFHDPARVEGPLELLACQGMIGEMAEGGLNIHLHGLMSAPDMRVYGGHFLEDGNPVLVTAEIMIHEIKDVRVIKDMDEETGFPIFTFHSR
ncbi:MAG: DNA-binding protein [Desulfobacterales bacterium]|nr:DNA-binding protein [Desulfobacterales bacterium]